MHSFRAYVLLLATRVLDVLLVGAAGLVAFWWRFVDEPMPLDTSYAVLMLFAMVLTALIFPLFGVYRSWRARGLMAPVGQVWLALAVLFSVLLVGMVLVKSAETFSRLWLFQWGVLAAGLLASLRLGVYVLLRVMRARGVDARRVVVVGCGAAANDLIARADAERWAGLSVQAVFAGGDAETVDAVQGRAVQPLADLTAYLAEHPVDEVWVAVPFEHGHRLRQILEELRFSTANVRFVPDLFGLFLINHGVSTLLDTVMIDLSASPMTGVNRLVKALEDRLLAGLILLLISPLMVLLAAGVRLSSPGPVFYRQKRHGWDGRAFTIYKFRSMRVDADADAAGHVPQAVRGDARITRFGAFLRRTSLDELPQFINVLQGRMSIVGPRPHALAHNETFKAKIDGYMLRHKVKPGITGWAQINGWRGETDTLEKMQRRVEFDLYYIEHWSLWFDLKIIFLTLIRGFVHRNAY